MKLNNLIGQRFGRLVVIERAENSKSGRVQWLCKCDCRNTCVVAANNLGRTTSSCGCLADESRKSVKHGQRHHRIYYIWCSMKQRCLNPKSQGYKLYGAKGISICSDWATDFEAFYQWVISNSYDDTLSIDRIDNAKGYEPSNCRWITMKQQQNNRSTNQQIEHDGETHTISEWSEITKLPPRLIVLRLSRGWPVSRALMEPENDKYRNHRSPRRST